MWPHLQTLLKRFIDTVKSNKFFYFVLGLFVFEAIWIALSAVYPMAFDEDYHFGLIQLYSHHWIPFLSSQPPGADKFGAVAHDPSYLYHYLLSFPYRLINLFTHNTNAQIIILRFINIGFFASGILIFKRVLERAKLSNGISNLIFLIFALTPLTSLLAAQINYDNLLFPLAGLSILLTIKLVERIDKGTLKLPFVAGWLSFMLLTSLVKYAFLPIFLAEFMFVAYKIIKYSREHKGYLRRVTGSINFRKINLKYVGWTIALIISLGLFGQRYLVNVIEYHNPVPDCAKVLSVQQCSAYSPWERNYSFIQQKGLYPTDNVWKYTFDWAHTLIYGMFNAINGPASGYYAQPPLPLPEWTAVIIGVTGFILLLFLGKYILKNTVVKLFMLISAVYVLMLWFQNYEDYHNIGVAVAIQGRYLIPVLILLYALVALSFRELLKGHVILKPALAMAILVLMVLGGGVSTFIIRGDDSWEWGNPTVNKVNHAAQKVVKSIVPGSKLKN